MFLLFLPWTGYAFVSASGVCEPFRRLSRLRCTAM